MSPFTRTWLAIAAISAGVVHLALVAGAPLPIAAVLLILGLGELVWGLLAFARDEPVAPRVARLVAVTPVVTWSLLVVVSVLLDAPGAAASLTLLPMAVATVFELFVAAVLSVHLRSDDATDPRDATVFTSTAVSAPSTGPADARLRPLPSAPRYLAGIAAGALVASLLVTPALAASEAGRYAQPHGTHQQGVAPAPESDADPLAVLDLGDHGAH